MSFSYDDVVALIGNFIKTKPRKKKLVLLTPTHYFFLIKSNALVNNKNK